MSIALPLHSIRRKDTEGGSIHALLVNPNTPDAAWAVISPFTCQSAVLKADSEVKDWLIAYNADTPPVHPHVNDSSQLPVGTVRRLIASTHAVKIADDEWLVYLRERAFSMACDVQVANWAVAYVPSSLSTVVRAG